MNCIYLETFCSSVDTDCHQDVTASRARHTVALVAKITKMLNFKVNKRNYVMLKEGMFLTYPCPIVEARLATFRFFFYSFFFFLLYFVEWSWLCLLLLHTPCDMTYE